MNDAELDQMLKDWKAPAAPDALRANALAQFRAMRSKAADSGRFTDWLRGSAPRMFAGGFLSLVAILFVVSKALPQTIDLTGIPYAVESQIFQYTGGTAVPAMQITSYNRDGSEVVLAKSIPDSMVGTLFLHAVESFHGMIGQPVGHFHQMTTTPDSARAGLAKVVVGCNGVDCIFTDSRGWGHGPELLKAGCVYEGSVVGRETILGYPTVAIERTWAPMRTTLWMAPGLGCFALRIKTEEVLSTGEIRLVTEKRALKVTVHARAKS